MRQCENGHFYDEARYETCPYCRNSAGSSKTVAVAPQHVGKTVPVASDADPADRGKTIGIIKKEIGIDPAVGFVVCIDGPHKGADFRLRSGRNFIGRSSSMDVSLADDDTVSRENHALITYDVKHNTFTLSPGMGRGITYLNNAQTEAAVQLNLYDVIEVGRSKLIFLPLCSERFQWDEP